MAWKKIILYPTSACLKNCPICPVAKGQPEDKNPEFFKLILHYAYSIPDWCFVLGLPGSVCRPGIEDLIRYASESNHTYSVVIPCETLSRLELALFQRSRRVIVCLDEYKLPDSEFFLFYRALEWAYYKRIPLEVMISLTERMIEKIIAGLMVDRLLNICRKIHFIVPKTVSNSFLTRDRFNDLLDYLIPQMQRPMVLSKFELDPCLMPILAPQPIEIFPTCAYLDTLTVFPDGSVKICPHGSIIGRIKEIKDFADFLDMSIDPQPLNACRWRQSWNVQEGYPGYKTC